MNYRFKPWDMVGFWDVHSECLIDCLAEYVLNISKMRMYKRLNFYMPAERLILKDTMIASLLIQELLREGMHI